MAPPVKSFRQGYKDSEESETPSNSLWIGNLTTDVTDSDLMALFGRFGAVDVVISYSARSYAFVFFKRVEDAQAAKNALQGAVVRGTSIKIEFARPDQWDGRFQGQNMGRADIQSGNERQPPSHFVDRPRGESQPSKVLWVGYPASLQIDEQMLHNAMILFGEIEKIKIFPSRHYSFVEFRSIDEARRAKEGLQGRLFNDPRITIMFSNSDLALGKDYTGGYGGAKGSRPEIFHNERLDVMSHNHHPLGSNNFNGLVPSGAPLGGPNMLMRSFGHGNLEPLLPGPDFIEFQAPHSLHDANSKSFMGSNMSRLSPSSGILSSPVPGIQSSLRSSVNTWDVMDKPQFERESKRLRVDSTTLMGDNAFPIRKIDQGSGPDQQYRFGPIAEGRVAVPYTNATWRNRVSPVGANVKASGPILTQPDNEFVWRGMIAKGGTPVCHARCVPIGKGISSELPEVVNCSARTGLDQLTKHYAEAIGFDVVFFLPDSENDFASYTEFLHYLGGKNRAGVAKFDDGTTLFLVPPSDFLRKVLKVGGPERLYGVVLIFPQPPNNELPPPQLNLPIPPQYIERKQALSVPSEYDQISLKDERIPPPDYTRPLYENSNASPKPLFSSVNESLPVQLMPQSSIASVSQAGVSLTPELIATLASLIPGKNQSSTVENNTKLQSGPSTIRPALPPPGLQDQQTAVHGGHSFSQVGTHANNVQGQSYMQYKSYPSLSTMPNGSVSMQDSIASQSQQVPLPPRPLTNYSAPESGQAPNTLLANPQYQQDVSRTSMGAYGAVHGVDLSAQSQLGVQQLTNYPSLTSQGQGVNYSQPQTTTQLTANRVNTELPNQVQQVQSGGTGSVGPEVEVDKNQRYQSTLQFAASLLQQIQQQQAARNS